MKNPALVTTSDSHATLPRSDTDELIERLQELTSPFMVNRAQTIYGAISTIQRLTYDVRQLSDERKACENSVVEAIICFPNVSEHVARLEKERDSALAAIELGQQNCDAAYEDLRKERDTAREQRDELQAITERLYGDIVLLKKERDEWAKACSSLQPEVKSPDDVDGWLCSIREVESLLPEDIRKQGCAESPLEGISTLANERDELRAAIRQHQPRPAGAVTHAAPTPRVDDIVFLAVAEFTNSEKEECVLADDARMLERDIARLTAEVARLNTANSVLCAELANSRQEIPESSLRRPTGTETHAAAAWIPLDGPNGRSPTEADCDKHGKVLMVHDDNSVGVFASWFTCRVTHWMRLPAPPPAPTPAELEQAEDSAAWAKFSMAEGFKLSPRDIYLAGRASLRKGKQE